MARQVFLMNMEPGAQEKFLDEERRTLHNVCAATQLNGPFGVLERLDRQVKDDWLGGIDALPGNMYLVTAFNLGCPSFSSGLEIFEVVPKHIAKQLGMIVVFLIQLFAPPCIFFQYVCGYGMEEHEKLHWDKFKFDLSDWYPEKEFYFTKISGVLFLSCFCLNGTFCHLDEKNAWGKVYRVINWLTLSGFSNFHAYVWLYIAAFMNSWVIVWLCLDVFLVLGSAESVVEIVLDALGLAFLYNLDDIAADLRFIDDDDWPGHQLAWLDKNIETAKGDPEHRLQMTCGIICGKGVEVILMCVAGVLMVFCAVLPVTFICVPWKEIKPDPFFESVTEAYLNARYVAKTVR
jgi:hypothetical protein